MLHSRRCKYIVILKVTFSLNEEQKRRIFKEGRNKAALKSVKNQQESQTLKAFLQFRQFFNNFQSEYLSVSNPSLHIFTHLPPTPSRLQLHILSSPYHPLAIPPTPKTIVWLPRSDKKHGNSSLSFPVSHVRLLYHKHAILTVHILKQPQPLSHPPKSSLIFHLCPIFFMKIPRLLGPFIFHCTGFPTHSVGIQLPSHAII